MKEENFHSPLEFQVELSLNLLLFCYFNLWKACKVKQNNKTTKNLLSTTLSVVDGLDFGVSDSFCCVWSTDDCSCCFTDDIFHTLLTTLAPFLAQSYYDSVGFDCEFTTERFLFYLAKRVKFYNILFASPVLTNCFFLLFSVITN